MKIASIVGARPQFIKAATISRAGAHLDEFNELLIHTGQHFDDNMSKIFFDELELPEPNYHLGIGGGSHGAMTGRMLERLEEVILDERPDWVLVYGDTNSTLAGAVAATKLHVPTAHLEAGLRSFNRRMPEEINRVLTDHAADLLFTPTDTATQNLLKEGIDQSAIRQVGDVMYDAALFSGHKADNRSTVLESLNVDTGQYLLATVHRQENTNDADRLGAIFGALQDLSRELPVVIPLHPRTKKALVEQNLSHLLKSLNVSPPLGYLDMAMLEKNASVIATDSGGVQKEAYFYSVPCITLRDETEWIELVEMGWNRVVPPKTPHIADKILTMIGQKGSSHAPYGDGTAARQVCQLLLNS